MQVDTGEIISHNVLKDIKESRRNEYIQIERMPKPDCSKCNGKGYIGRYVSGMKKGQVIPCDCVL